MGQGISLHIGLNRVDPARYNNWDGALVGCENDARAMKAIADACGYSSATLLSEHATSLAVFDAVGAASQRLSKGDHFLLTYSGHGGQVQDSNGDEGDGRDETWVLFDRMVVDDELYSLWSQFAAGVRIFALSDSCHSGTVVRDLQAARDFFAAIRPALTRGYGISSEPRIKRIDPATLAAIETRDRAVYRSVQWTAGDSRELINEIEARIIGISACQDNQVALDGDTNGLFTSALLKVWANGTFQGGYDGFASAIIAGMPFSQTPNFYKIGAEDLAFDSYKPFEILEAASVQPAGNGPQTHPSEESATAGPSVIGPGSTDRAKPPAFEVVRGVNPYYVFEIASEADLFDNPPRFNDYRYYASSNDGSASARETSPHYQLSPAAWDLIKRNDTLYYRITTMAGPSGWSHCETSTVRILTVTDGLGKSAPTPSGVRRRPPAPHIM